MAAIFEKLNLKSHSEILVVNAPESFEPELAALEGVRILREAGSAQSIRFALVFATKRAEVSALVAKICPKVEGDAILWFAYPKGSSRKYKCDFNRDNGWQSLGDAGFEGVRMVSIDEDWSALRFRHISYIKSFNRDAARAQSARGKRRAAAK